MPIVGREPVIRDPNQRALAMFGWNREDPGDLARSGDGQTGLTGIRLPAALVRGAVTVEPPAGK